MVFGTELEAGVKIVYIWRNTMVDHNLIFEKLKKLHIARAVVEFSGGNDNGGLDSINLYDDLNEIKVIDRLDRKDPELYDMLGETLDDEINFNGDYSVHGEVEWNLITRTCNLTKYESVVSYHTETINLYSGGKINGDTV